MDLPVIRETLFLVRPEVDLASCLVGVLYTIVIFRDVSRNDYSERCVVSVDSASRVVRRFESVTCMRFVFPGGYRRG